MVLQARLHGEFERQRVRILINNINNLWDGVTLCPRGKIQLPLTLSIIRGFKWFYFSTPGQPFKRVWQDAIKVSPWRQWPESIPLC